MRVAAVIRIFALTASLTSSISAQAPSPPASDLIGVGNFIHVVANLEKSLAFYKDALGMEPNGPIRNLSITSFGNPAGGRSRSISLHIADNYLGVELIEFKGTDRKPVQNRFQDPGNASLIVLVRDVDAMATRLKAAGGRVLGNSPSPFPTPGGSKHIFIQDPDGFIVHLTHGEAADRVTYPTGNAVGLGLALTVDSAERTKEFYRDLLKLDFPKTEVTNPDDDTIGRALGTLFQTTIGWFPNKNFSIGFIEVRDGERKTLNSALQDPGTPVLQLIVRDLEGMLRKLKAAGYSATLPTDLPVTLDDSQFVIVKDPNSLRIKFAQRAP